MIPPVTGISRLVGVVTDIEAPIANMERITAVGRLASPERFTPAAPMFPLDRLNDGVRLVNARCPPPVGCRAPPPPPERDASPPPPEERPPSPALNTRADESAQFSQKMGTRQQTAAVFKEVRFMVEFSYIKGWAHSANCQ